MLKTAKLNLKNYPDKKVKFVYMDNLKMNFPKETFDLISARHTIINAKQIYNCLVEGGAIIIEGIDKKDCWEIKDNESEHKRMIEKNLFEKYVDKYTSKKGILLKRRLYGIIATKTQITREQPSLKRLI